MATDAKRLYPVVVGGKRGAGGKLGYIDARGELVIPPRYDVAQSFNDGLAVVANWYPDRRTDPVNTLWRQQTGVIDLAGAEVVPLRYDQIRDYAEGRAAFRSGRKWGFLDAGGAEVVKPQFAEADSFSEGVAVVETGPQAKRVFAVIDPGGAVLFEKRVSRLASCHDGLMATATHNRWSYLNRSGETAFEVTCAAAGEFSEGLASVLVQHRIGYIDTAGRIVIEPKFPQAGRFREGLVEVAAPLAEGEKRTFDKPTLFGFADRQGAMAIEAKYEFCQPFSGGLAPVKIGGGFHGYVDRTGRMAIPPIRCQAAWSFTGELAMIRVGDDEDWYITREGKFVWPLQE
jgi:hypothetical protein